NYLWLEAGTNFGVLDDDIPSAHRQSTSMHLVTLLRNAGVSWKAYQEDIPGTTCPVDFVKLYTPNHCPMVYFNDVTSSADNCISHIRPYTELSRDLETDVVPAYSFITPNYCNDMHDSTG